MNLKIIKKSFGLLLFPWLSTNQIIAQGFLVTHPKEPNAVLSENFKVFVNETEIPVLRVATNNDVSYAQFSFAGQITIRIHVNKSFSSFNLSPHSYGIVTVTSGQDISFKLDRPRKMLLQQVGSLNEHLCIIAEPVEDDQPKIRDANIVNILDKGTDPSGASDDLRKIQTALNDLPKNSTLYFPPGRYTLGGTLAMQSNRSIYIAAGATLQSSDTAEIQFNFDNASNVKIFGRGSIDGRGDIHRPKYKGEGGKPIIYKSGGNISSACTIKDITLKGAVTWTAIVTDTKDWNVYNLKVINGKKYPNHDCWDPHNAVRMMMDNMFLYGADDAIAYSTTRNNLDLNTTIRNSVFYNGLMGATVRIGPWIGANTKNITVENNDHLLGGNNDYTLAFYLGGSISNLKYLNNRIENAQQGLLLIRTSWDDHYAGRKNGSLNNLYFDRLLVEKVEKGWGGHYSQIEANSDTNFVKSVTFKDFYQKGILQNNAAAADINIDGKHVSDLVFTKSTTPVVQISAKELITYPGSVKPAAFIISRKSDDNTKPLTVFYMINGTAINGKDYSVIRNVVVIPAGANSVKLIVSSVRKFNERFKTVFLKLESSKEYMLGPNYDAVVTIINNDIPEN